MVGNDWVKAGVAVDGVLNMPFRFPSEKKKRPMIELIEMGFAGTSQLTLTELELCPVYEACTVSAPLFAPV